MGVIIPRYFWGSIQLSVQMLARRQNANGTISTDNIDNHQLMYAEVVPYGLNAILEVVPMNIVSLYVLIYTFFNNINPYKA